MKKEPEFSIMYVIIKHPAASVTCEQRLNLAARGYNATSKAKKEWGEAELELGTWGWFHVEGKELNHYATHLPFEIKALALPPRSQE